MKTILSITAITLLTTSCAQINAWFKPAAHATLKPTFNNSAHGTIQFTQEDKHVLMVANIQGLPPGLHGFHIHEKGDCSAPDGTSAGGHFNPHHHQHGMSHAMGGHAGDMGNLNADAAGNAQFKFELEGVEISNAANGILGRAVIIHAQPDDLHSQPTGNAGARVACGVIVAGQ